MLIHPSVILASIVFFFCFSCVCKDVCICLYEISRCELKFCQSASAYLIALKIDKIVIPTTIIGDSVMYMYVGRSNTACPLRGIKYDC